MATVLKLYETVDALEAVRAWLDEPEHVEALIQSGGDLDALPELCELLERAELDFNTKVERVALVALEYKRTAEFIGAEVDRLAALKKSAENSERSLKSYLQVNLQRANTKRVDGKLAKVRVQANPISVRSTLTPEQLEALHRSGCRFIAETILYAIPPAVVQQAYKAALEDIGPPPELGESEYFDKLATWRTGLDEVLRAAGLPQGVSVERGAHVRIQ